MKHTNLTLTLQIHMYSFKLISLAMRAGAEGTNSIPTLHKPPLVTSES